MNVQMDFSPQYEAQLITSAHQLGMELPTYVARLVQEKVPPAELTMPTITFPPTGRAVAYLRERLIAEATDDPEELRKAQEEFDEMKMRMNEERLHVGTVPRAC